MTPSDPTPPSLDPAALDRLARSAVVPALRWDGEAYRVEGSEATASELVRAGAPGFIVFGGTARAAAETIRELRAESDHPLLFGADLERGAGQQFDGATPLPPAGALGGLDDVDVTRAAAELTAREARAIGIDLLFAPVADVAAVPDNPIVGPRAFSGDVEAAARHVRAWVEGALAGGAYPCVKHFPGHGRTSGDSHVGEVRVEAEVSVIERELAPFRAAIDAGVPLVMPGHLVVPAVDPEKRIATVSGPILRDLLRERLGFEGVVVTDALLMAGAGELASTVVAAVRAGVDLPMYPAAVETAIGALAEAAEDDEVLRSRLAESAERVRALAEGAEDRSRVSEVGGADALERATAWATASIRRVRGGAPPPGPDAAVTLVDVDDDVGGPYPPPSRDPFREALTGGTPGAPATDGHRTDGHRTDGRIGSAPATVVALWADTRGWKGRAGLSETARRALREAIDAAAPGEPVHVVVFGGARVVEDVPEGATVWLAWGGEPLMQAAAAARLRDTPG